MICTYINEYIVYVLLTEVLPVLVKTMKQFKKVNFYSLIKQMYDDEWLNESVIAYADIKMTK